MKTQSVVDFNVFLDFSTFHNSLFSRNNMNFGDLQSRDGLLSLDKFLADKSYILGYAFCITVFPEILF